MRDWKLWINRKDNSRVADIGSMEDGAKALVAAAIAHTRAVRSIFSDLVNFPSMKTKSTQTRHKGFFYRPGLGSQFWFRNGARVMCQAQFSRTVGWQEDSGRGLCSFWEWIIEACFDSAGFCCPFTSGWFEGKIFFFFVLSESLRWWGWIPFSTAIWMQQNVD
jgi:hypothetical protein